MLQHASSRVAGFFGAIVVSMGEAAKPLFVEGFKTGCNVVSRRRRGTSWHSNMFHDVSKMVWYDRRNTFATFSEDALHCSWKAQHFGDLRCHFAWQAQHFWHVVLRIFGESHCQGCATWWHSPLHSTLYTPNFTLHTLNSTLHFTLYTPHFKLYTWHFTLYTPHFKLYTWHFTLRTPHFTLYTFHSTLHTLHFTLSTPYTLHSTLFTLHPIILYTVYSTLSTFHFTLYTPHFTL